MKKLILGLIPMFQFYGLFAQEWKHFDSIRRVYQARVSYDTALVYAEKALDAAGAEFGENDTVYANMLTALVEAYYYNSLFDKALACAVEDSVLRRKIQGTNNAGYATTLSWLAYIY
ncbi:MAG: hypothetical protein KJ607_13625 [Bacteroidetes bacterium]|nr:hypothetical protein [Bacteroidota bacterium]